MRPFPPSVSSVNECSERRRFLLFLLAASAIAAAAASWAAAAERKIAGSSFLNSKYYIYMNRFYLDFIDSLKNLFISSKYNQCQNFLCYNVKYVPIYVVI